jgi:hypothetical protein
MLAGDWRSEASIDINLMEENRRRIRLISEYDRRLGKWSNLHE